MLIISKQNNQYIKQIIKNMTVKDWTTALNDNVPLEVVVTIDDDHALFEKVVKAGNFEPVVKDGDLTDIIELPPVKYEIPPQTQISELVNNLNLTDHVIIKRVEAILPALYEMLGIEKSSEDMRKLRDVSEERQSWRDEINVLETKISTPVKG